MNWMVGEILVGGAVGGTGVVPLTFCALHPESNNATNAKPIIKENNLFFTFFIFPEIVGNNYRSLGIGVVYRQIWAEIK
ncbi:MAG: hypothetical protein AUJ21_05465 [Anaerolineae bacterium CG1_02_58_13]|nr:MAG: hypothetical protein A3K41_06895 [Chloroflexi bacterium RIFOXYD12_FULL_57_15]OIN93854.1 MAG: hypothetical protein AUJ21_05465 [Anaerolineae bacterium CG1_02_58_13]